jgi:hypothetical protein
MLLRRAPSEVAVSDILTEVSAATSSLSEISKLKCVPGQAEAGLLLGWLLMHSHSTGLSRNVLSTFNFTTPWIGPELGDIVA